LRRETVKDEDLSAAKSYVKGARVLITGGGGSIGSELARQVAKLEPLELVLLGKGENSVFEASQDLLRRDYEAKSVVADIRDRAALETIFETYRPTVVFHAAAHKHVPLMEHNPIEAVKNNVLGTKNVAELAARFGVKKFVQISTDKAVNPTNVMGATKRVAEMIVRSMAQRAETEFAIVRFGNVLGSRGSLVPTLKKQIKDGGPVTLTDARMTRYFMTIPEAVHLILQAGAIGKTGDVFILDMGEPIKIYDLAKELIRLYGLVPDEDMKIEFIGARPGEKLHEELSYATESLEATEYAKIRRIAPTMIDETWLDSEVAWLIDLCAQRDQGQVRGRLMQLATEDGASPLKYAVIDEPSVESPTDRV
jgi:FlaA1/EpsC-like NDP-sugar epimerase